MLAKLLTEEEGNYINRSTGKKVNMLLAVEWVRTPDGDISDWIEVEDEQDAMVRFNLKKIIKDEML